MNLRRTTSGLCLLCALFVSALAAQSASAAGTTAYTCKNTGAGGTFKAAHCKPSDAGSGNFSHVAIANGTTTEITISDLNTAGEHTGAILKDTIAGSAVELTAKEVSGSGTMSNGTEAGEMFASGEGVLVYSGVTEDLLGCEVIGIPGGPGVIETKTLIATTKGLGDKLKVSPKAGIVLAEFELKNCIFGTVLTKVVGSVLGDPDGATVNTVHNTVTADKTVRTNNVATGPVVGIAGTLTISGRSGGSGPYTPLSVTT